MPGTTIGRGNILYDFMIGPTLTPVSVAANTSAEQNFTILGLQSGDGVDVNLMGAQTAGIGIVNARVSANNTLTIMFSNSTGSGATPVSGQYVITVCRPELGVALPTNAL